MQWRSLILLLSGITTIYLTMLLQDRPHPHPKLVFSSNPPSVFVHKPDKVIINTVGSYIYVTTFKFEAPQGEGSFIGTKRLKIGVRGIIKQVRMPISNALTQRDLLKSEGWTLCFEHELKGHISQIASKNNDYALSEQTQFAVLYHQIDKDNSYHYVRIYYTEGQDFSTTFKSKDIKLPGTTWVDSISLENDSLLFSRDPDLFEFNIMPLPTQMSDLVDSEEYPIKRGRSIQEWSQPYSTERYSTLLSRLYSPNKDTYRVFMLSIHKTPTTYYVNITIADDITANDNLSTWIQREKGESDYPVYSEESIEHVGYAEMTNYRYIQPENKQDSIELFSAMSADAKTIVFPYIKNKFITLDFTDRIDILSKIPLEKERLYSNDGRKTVVNEYYYWQGYETVEADIMGVQLDQEGDHLAIWTEQNYVYLYGRNKHERTRKEQASSFVERWIDHLLSEMSEEERALRNQYFPAPWQLEMAIIPIKDEHGRVKPIGSVKFWKDHHNNRHYLFVGLKNGKIYTYRLDQYEPEKVSDFCSFAIERWDMLLAMSSVICIFVYNEYQRSE
ncbi:hypothetical protein BD560DRAFT_382098 [Blakeslea trispora]|nr:hypothetical protein BD560DRAFT_382098 [Blakeslea trispora]